MAEALRTVVAPALRLTDADRQALAPYATVVRHGTGEALEQAGQVPIAMTVLTEGSKPASSTPTHWKK